MTDLGVAIKWRTIDDEKVGCWYGPVEGDEPTDEWVPILIVNRKMLAEDAELFPALIEVVKGSFTRMCADLGVDDVTFTVWQGKCGGTT